MIPSRIDIFSKDELFDQKTVCLGLSLDVMGAYGETSLKKSQSDEHTGSQFDYNQTHHSSKIPDT